MTNRKTFEGVTALFEDRKERIFEAQPQDVRWRIQKDFQGFSLWTRDFKRTRA